MDNGRVLITFDVDGTLMKSVGLDANKLHKRAFSYAFKTVFNVDGTIDAIKHHGSTDQLVALRTLEHYGIPSETAQLQLGRIGEQMLKYAREHAEEVREGLELLPGVEELLATLAAHPQAVVGLVTGNLEEIAWLKMNGLGILQYFSVPNFGGFGSDHVDRGELVKLAAQRATDRFPGEAFRLRVHVGDTPNDVQAAEVAGAIAIGVSTGIFSREELLTSSGSPSSLIVLDDLVDKGTFLKACQLSVHG
eukprot:jgi/Mesen1/4874/ME000244S04054